MPVQVCRAAPFPAQPVGHPAQGVGFEIGSGFTPAAKRPGRFCRLVKGKDHQLSPRGRCQPDLHQCLERMGRRQPPGTLHPLWACVAGRGKKYLRPSSCLITHATTKAGFLKNQGLFGLVTCRCDKSSPGRSTLRSHLRAGISYQTNDTRDSQTVTPRKSNIATRLSERTVRSIPRATTPMVITNMTGRCKR